MRWFATLCLILLCASTARAWSTFGLSGIGLGIGPSAARINPYQLQITGNPGATYYWRANEFSGTTAAETIAGVNKGTYIANPTLNQPGPARTGDGAPLFNGTTQYIQTTSSLVNPGSTGYSLEVWFKTASAFTCPIATAMPLIQFNTTQAPGATDYDRNLYMGTDCKIHFAQFQNAIVSVISPLTYADANWHYAVGEWDGTNMFLYIDGNLVVGPTASPGPQNFTGFWVLSSGYLNGWPAAGTTVSYWNGYAGEFAIYNAALTTSQIFQHYTGNLPTLNSIITTCAPASIAPAGTSNCTAQGVYSNGGSQNITSACAWSSLSPSIATVNSAGVATGVANGTATIRCTDP